MISFAPRVSDGDHPHERKEKRFSATHNGFDVHCAVRIAADDDEGRERLIRSCARPPFARERIEERKDGRISYLMKTPRRGSTHRVMTPVEFLARLAILIPRRISRSFEITASLPPARRGARS